MTCEQTVDIGACTTSGTNTTANHTNYVVQYPKPYRRTDGRWIAVGSLIGSLWGGYSNQKIVEKAEKADDTWNKLTDNFKDKGQWLFNEHADKLTACTDELHIMLCAIAKCGYKPNYEDIAIRVRATAMKQTELERIKLCRVSHRYKTGVSEDVYRSLALAETQAVTSALTQAIETTRREAFELNYKLLSQITDQIEGDLNDRLRLGAQFMDTAARSYRDLANSYRATAKESVGDIATIGALLGFILPMLMEWFKDPEDTCGGEEGGTGGTGGGGAGGGGTGGGGTP